MRRHERCMVCHVDLPADARARRYCSNRCRQKQYRKRLKQRAAKLHGPSDKPGYAAKHKARIIELEAEIARLENIIDTLHLALHDRSIDALLDDEKMRNVYRATVVQLERLRRYTTEHRPDDGPP